MPRYYFDHNATTPVSPEVVCALTAALTDVYGNASSVHQDGQAARQRLESARADIAQFLGCGIKEIVFTSGGTEADNLAIFGAVRATTRDRKHVITSAIEHPAVLNACAQLEREGVEVTYVQPSRTGVIDPDYVRRQMRPHTVLISIMHANNETGVLQPIEAIGAIARDSGVLFHSDGVQATGKIPVALSQLPVDLYTISAHKVYAPKGFGALYVRQGVSIRPTQFGGRHERSRRAGTENVPGAIAAGVAASWMSTHLAEETTRLATLRDHLERTIVERVPDVVVNGAGAPRVSNTTNISFDGLDGEAMVISLDLRGFAVSTGAACSSGAVEPSHVLTSMGLDRDRAKSSIRFSLGRFNTLEQVDALADAIVECAAHLRKLSPTYA